MDSVAPTKSIIYNNGNNKAFLNEDEKEVATTAADPCKRLTTPAITRQYFSNGTVRKTEDNTVVAASIPIQKMKQIEASAVIPISRQYGHQHKMSLITKSCHYMAMKNGTRRNVQSMNSTDNNKFLPLTLRRPEIAVPENVRSGFKDTFSIHVHPNQFRRPDSGIGYGLVRKAPRHSDVTSLQSNAAKQAYEELGEYPAFMPSKKIHRMSRSSYMKSRAVTDERLKANKAFQEEAQVLGTAYNLMPIKERTMNHTKRSNTYTRPRPGEDFRKFAMVRNPGLS